MPNEFPHLDGLCCENRWIRLTLRAAECRDVSELRHSVRHPFVLNDTQFQERENPPGTTSEKLNRPWRISAPRLTRRCVLPRSLNGRRLCPSLPIV